MAVPIIQVWGVRAGRKRAAGDTTQPAIPLARITTGWACQISIAALFQTITVRTKVPDHGELFRARRWSGKVQRLKSTVVGTSGSFRTKPPAILFAARAEPHRPVAPADSRAAQVVFNHNLTADSHSYQVIAVAINSHTVRGQLRTR